MKKRMETEKVPLAYIYKQNGRMCIKCNDSEVNWLELLGFLRCYSDMLEEEITWDMMDASAEGEGHTNP